MGEISEDGPDDIEGLDASVAHIANMLSTKPADIKLGIGGFSMGAATALYSATCFTQGKYGNGNPYPINLRAIVGLSGWLPGSRLFEYLSENSLNFPVILHIKFPKGIHRDDLVIGAGTNARALLVDGLGDGILLEAPDQDFDFLRNTSFNLLQGCRMRNTKTAFSLHNRWKVFRGDGSDSKDLIFSAKLYSLFQLKTKLDVFLAHNKREKVCNFKVKGNWSERSCITCAGESTNHCCPSSIPCRLFFKATDGFSLEKLIRRGRLFLRPALQYWVSNFRATFTEDKGRNYEVYSLYICRYLIEEL